MSSKCFKQQTCAESRQSLACETPSVRCKMQDAKCEMQNAMEILSEKKRNRFTKYLQ